MKDKQSYVLPVSVYPFMCSLGGPSWAKLGEDPAQATGVFQCHWRSSSDTQSVEGDYAK